MKYATDMSRSLPVRLTLILVFILTTKTFAAEPSFLAFPLAPLFAADDDFGNAPAADPTGLFNPTTMPWYLAGAIAMAFLLTYWIAWFFAYPWLLRRGNTLPVTLFGKCTAAACLISWGIVVAVYWEGMNLPPHAPWWREWGLRLLCLAIMAGTTLFSVLHWRSKADTQTP